MIRLCISLYSCSHIRVPRCLHAAYTAYAYIWTADGGHCEGACRLQMFFLHPLTEKMGPPFYAVMGATFVHMEELILENHTHIQHGYWPFLGSRTRDLSCARLAQIPTELRLTYLFNYLLYEITCLFKFDLHIWYKYNIWWVQNCATQCIYLNCDPHVHIMLYFAGGLLS